MTGSRRRAISLRSPAMLGQRALWRLLVAIAGRDDPPFGPFQRDYGHVTDFLQLKAESTLGWIARQQGEIARPLRDVVADLQRLNLAGLTRNPLNDPKNLGYGRKVLRP